MTKQTEKRLKLKKGVHKINFQFFYPKNHVIDLFKLITTEDSRKVVNLVNLKRSLHQTRP
jgi:hypothetical protein